MNNKKNSLFVAGLLLFFLIIRLPGISLPYHQDEWKNVAASGNALDAGKFFAHPPLMQMMFVGAHHVFGDYNFRFFPLIFSVLSAVLLYLVIKNRSGKKVAIWSLFIYLLLFYNILGSLVPDVDGAILPFFFLLSVFCYDKWGSTSGKVKWKWFVLLSVTLLLGFLVKLSFILVIGAIIVDLILNNLRSITVKKIGYLILASGCFAGAYVSLIYFISFIYPPFDIKIMLGHAGQFSDGAGRNLIQVAVQGIKAVFYLSPLALVPLIFISREILRKTKLFSVFLIIGLVFYFVVFDFSRGALDKYLMFAIVPLAVIVGYIFAEIFFRDHRTIFWRTSLILGLVTSFLLLVTNFLPHEVLSLYPKTLWFSRILHGKWAILNPFNGGSGPLGFYVSFLFIAISFIVSALCALIGLWKKEWRQISLVVLIMIGVFYNAVFAEEFFFGKINGSAPEALEKSLVFIKEHAEIKKVITYSDIGAGPLGKMGKYAGRIYAVPESESGYKALFAKHEAAGGHFLVVGIPPLGTDTFYGKFFASCDSLFETTSGRIRADVYTCNTK